MGTMLKNPFPYHYFPKQWHSIWKKGELPIQLAVVDQNFPQQWTHITPTSPAAAGRLHCHWCWMDCLLPGFGAVGILCANARLVRNSCIL